MRKSPRPNKGCRHILSTTVNVNDRRGRGKGGSGARANSRPLLVSPPRKIQTLRRCIEPSSSSPDKTASSSMTFLWCKRSRRVKLQSGSLRNLSSTFCYEAYLSQGHKEDMPSSAFLRLPAGFLTLRRFICQLLSNASFWCKIGSYKQISLDKNSLYISPVGPCFQMFKETLNQGCVIAYCNPFKNYTREKRSWGGGEEIKLAKYFLIC